MDPVENYRPTMPEAVLRDWAQDAQKELVSLRARIDELSRAYAVQGLAIEEMTDERDRYLEALTTLEVQAVPEIAPDWVGIPTVEFDAAMRILKEPTK